MIFLGQTLTLGYYTWKRLLLLESEVGTDPYIFERKAEIGMQKRCSDIIRLLYKGLFQKF